MAKAVSLANLIAPWMDIRATEWADIQVERLTLDSRQVTAGCTFVAIKGHLTDGRQYIQAAIENGANAIIAEASEAYPHGTLQPLSGVVVLYLAELGEHLSQLAGRRYPLEQNRLIGVTGTNGKTTITQLIAQWLELLGHRAAVMGTTGNGFLDQLQPAANTTGNAIEIFSTLHQLQDAGAEYTALEVSSHGLVQGRIKALDFEVGVFSNLSRDHLDYHGSMEQYADAKLSLFTRHNCQQAVINIDDEVGRQWIEQLLSATAVSLQPVTGRADAVWAESIRYSEAGISMTVAGRYGRGELNTALIGEFNASNVLLALTTLLSLGIELEQLLKTAPLLKPVLGRMELFSQPGKAKIVVDYAHTPDALEKALQALKVHCQGKLWTIVGCGGDRDRGKRPMMAEIAERIGDQLILTDDNPRSEDPSAIVADMVAGLEQPDLARVEHDRFKALQIALQHATDKDIILLAGKGHEDYQVLADRTVHYSDRESAQQLLGETA
ncbi:UDP-N-acetylmuramoyl-L-alanyl-D-glutamate--2,6-diaminopimelate ligase [Vibrio sp.]|uniref:UDP-N-acetylmuramoyl-L-alanyl-D-glutamate--2, 6-diaminopimelate ligase n=1 Tax=Vibrio sp. TaxID=678 RepID=UPI003D14DF6A